MGEYLEDTDNYFLSLTWNYIYDNNADIMCMICSEIESIRNRFMMEVNLIDLLYKLARIIL